MSVANTVVKAQEKLDNETAMCRRATMEVCYISNDFANVQRAIMFHRMFDLGCGSVTFGCQE